MPIFPESNKFSQNFIKKSPFTKDDSSSSGSSSSSSSSSGPSKLQRWWDKVKGNVKEGLQSAGEKLSSTHVEKPSIIDTRGGSQSDVAPDVTTLLASSDNPIKPIEKKKSSSMTKKGKSPYRNYKKGYYGA